LKETVRRKEYVVSGFRLCAKRFGETRRSLGGGGWPDLNRADS
jgi:hypothetical protein